MSEVAYNRADGYPNDAAFDRATKLALEARRADEQEADEFLREMEKRLVKLAKDPK